MTPHLLKIQYVKGVEYSDIKRRRGLKRMNNKEGAG